MYINIKKCKVLCFGKSNQKFQYFMNGKPIHHFDFEKDLGVIIYKRFEFSEQ